MPDAYSFPTPCPVCKEDRAGKVDQPVFCMREEVRGDCPVRVWCSVCGSSWVISAEEKEKLRKLVDAP